ncbi:hypothetical protein EBZ37_09525 [bacterium]|nr:hypothetical protein [bacterium]
MMKKMSFAPIVGASFLLMGLSMPSCPGQQALQQQVDALKTADSEIRSLITAQDSQIKGLKEENERAKAMVSQLVATVTEQSKKLDELTEKVKTPPAPAAKPSKAKSSKKK